MPGGGGGGWKLGTDHLLVLLLNTPWLGALRMDEMLQQTFNDRVPLDALLQARKHKSPDAPGFRPDNTNVADHTGNLT